MKTLKETLLEYLYSLNINIYNDIKCAIVTDEIFNQAKSEYQKEIVYTLMVENTRIDINNFFDYLNTIDEWDCQHETTIWLNDYSWVKLEQDSYDNNYWQYYKVPEIPKELI